ncbi:MAG: tRNA pseudouridine(38-40) synthase TruA [Acidimicrobiia bacterium]|nr:tRNA pseudouridine(38-40) synthase TruA [Acidimicrobiia bacterium]NNL71436.1 tRNA pseudouridine(38-40) synthase TruA [Acidimicrobiia bacterium]
MNYRLDFSYDGTGFSGYAVQPGLRTIQGELQRALQLVLGDFTTHVAGRTDAGVHARHQVVNVGADREVPPETLLRALNRLLGPEMAFESVTIADPGFHARHHATGRTYRYFILNRRWHDPFRDRTTWHYRYPLDVDRLNSTAAHLIGEHEYASLCRKREGKSTRRTVRTAHWEGAPDDIVRFEIAADSFCHQMVRSIVALSAEIGRGNGDPDDIPAILERQDRNAARGAAPARGLFLWKVEY